MKMKVLFIAPLPPPITGNSLPVKIMYDALEAEYEITIVNLSKDSFTAGINSFARVLNILKVLKQVFNNRKSNDLIYFTISESFAGNMKDFVIYRILLNSLSKMAIHMLGGAGMKQILAKKRGVQYILNKYFIKKTGAIIVEGQTQANFFAEVADRKKIKVIPNFAEDFLFTSAAQIDQNFDDIQTVRLLFISNLIFGKGHQEIIESYNLLSSKHQAQIQIDFAGRFESTEEEEKFLFKIKDHKNITYHGLVVGEAKRQLYTQAHVFCLPTYYPYEGQPFCILEAYASGCVLITTNHSGIKNVFTDSLNGFEVEKQSVSSLKTRFEQILDDSKGLKQIAQHNLSEACDKYRAAIFVNSMKKTFEEIAGA